MALRYLLRRILVRPPKGISPPAASRFVATQSEGEQCLTLASVEQREKEVERLYESMRAAREEGMKAQAKLHNDQAVMAKNVRRGLDDLERYGRKWRIFGTASAAAMLASSALIVY